MSKYFVRLLVANVLPESVLAWVKKHYYAHFVKSFWEDDLLPVKALVKSGDSVIDMGANFGWYTNALSSIVGATGRVHSVEPIPDTFRVLSGIVRKLGLTNVNVNNYAMSNEDGTVVMRVPQHEYGGSNFYRAQIGLPKDRAASSVREYTVAMRSMDSLFLNLAESVTFIKCDVEGHELAVVQGGEKFLQRSKPAWLMEVGGNPDVEGTSAHQLFEVMRASGYEVYYFDGTLVRKRPAGHWSVNYLLLQPKHRLLLSHIMHSE